MQNNNLLELVQETVKKFIDPKAEVISIDSTPINMGFQAVELSRHSVQIKIVDDISKLSLVSKSATKIERQVLTRLYSQKASVPFSLSYGSGKEDRSLICLQDVDHQTDYTSINIGLLQKSEVKALSHIHTSNFGLRKELSWLPEVDSLHIEKIIYERWKPQWLAAKENEQFIDVFGEYIPLVEAVANTIIEDIDCVINDEKSHTLIHNDLRCCTAEQIEEYRELLAAKSIEFPNEYFNQMYAIASRYLGLRSMSWNLGAWTSNSQAKDDLKKYLDMVVGSLQRT